MYINPIDNCPHFSNTEFIDSDLLQFLYLNDIFHKDEENSTMKLVDLIFEEEKNEKRNQDKINKIEELNFESIFKKNILDDNNDEKDSKAGKLYFLCLSCALLLNSKEQIEIHLKEKNHYIAINLTDISIL